MIQREANIYIMLLYVQSKTRKYKMQLMFTWHKIACAVKLIFGHVSVSNLAELQSSNADCCFPVPPTFEAAQIKQQK